MQSMPQLTIDQALNLAAQYQAAGRVAEAESLYRQIIAATPTAAEPHYLLGNLLASLRRPDQSVVCFHRAAELNPGFAAAWLNLGNALHELGRSNEAIASLERAIQIAPQLPRPHYNLGSVFASLRYYDRAVECYQRSLAIDPDYAPAWNNLGIALQSLGRIEEATEAYRRAVAAKPHHVAAHNNLGTALQAQKQFEEAASCFEAAISLRPDYVEALTNLGVCLHACGRLDDSVAMFQRALALKPDHAPAFLNMGNALQDQGKLDDAANVFRRALALDPNYADALTNLGGILQVQGEITQALEYSRRALAVCPDHIAAHSNLIFGMHYDPNASPQEIFEESRRFNERHAIRFAHSIAQHTNDRNPDRPLRIGYVSADFRMHSVAYFLLPLLEAHNRQQFQVTCYATSVQEDEVTERFKKCVVAFKRIFTKTDEGAAELIRKDEIDILVDLAGHTSGGRLLVFARKPAPIQVTWLGYPNTTGLDAIDYRFTDAKADPPGLADRLCSEKLIRLPDTAWCYMPLSGSPEIAPLSALKNGYITFGSFNNRAKLAEPLLELWARLLRQVPGSKLLLKNQSMASQSVREKLARFFNERTIGADRLELVRPESTTHKHLEWYHRVDIALDSYPYHGTTTTCEATWMAVPTVSLLGEAHVSRVGLSLLATVGLEDLVAHSPNEYVSKTAALANDLPRLSDIRQGLRPKMQASALMDAVRFARNIEITYRQMWRKWCENQPPLTTKLGPIVDKG